jgi:hypothetical protein
MLAERLKVTASKEIRARHRDQTKQAVEHESNLNYLQQNVTNLPGMLFHPPVRKQGKSREVVNQKS